MVLSRKQGSQKSSDDELVGGDAAASTESKLDEIRQKASEYEQQAGHQRDPAVFVAEASVNS